MNLPSAVDIVEVGPRDGFQAIHDWIPTEIKVQVVDQLSRAGLRTIQVTSFVHPSAIPQLSDAEAVMNRIERRPGVTYEALVPNLKGAERALAAGADKLKLMLSVTDAHSMANANRSTAAALEQLVPVVRTAQERGVPVCGGLSVALGCPYEGFPPAERLLWIVGEYVALGVTDISVADTAGMANPVLVYDRLARLRERFPEVEFGLHLHDTRRMAAGNVLAALQASIQRFDGAVGGMGGCPYCPGATGNIATEDLVHMLEEMGIETGVDLEGLLAAAAFVRQQIPASADSALLRAGTTRSLRQERVERQSKLDQASR